MRLTKESAERVQLCPVYLQRLVKKEGDVRITVVANKIFATFINSQQKKDSKIDFEVQLISVSFFADPAHRALPIYFPSLS